MSGKIETKNEKKIPQQVEKKLISLRISEALFKRLENHILLLKHIDGASQSKQRWLSDAIKEKLEQEKFDFNTIEIFKEKNIALFLNSMLNEKLEKRINLIKKIKHGYSKKQWILEAIQAKLDREEQNAKSLFEKL